jgi:hypothetical protein
VQVLAKGLRSLGVWKPAVETYPKAACKRGILLPTFIVEDKVEI